MDFEYQLDKVDQDYVQLKLIGVADAASIENMFADLIGSIAEESINKVLIDGRHCVFDYAMSEFVPLMKRLNQYLSQLKVARWVDVELFRNEIIETHAQNENWRLKNFSERQDALTWLLQD